MKQTIQSMRTSIAYIFLFTIVLACNTGTKDSAGSSNRIPDSKHRILLSEKKVVHFNNWRELYKGQDSIRESFYVGHYMSGRGLEDTNQVYVIDLISDSSKVAEYLALPILNDMRNRTGVFDSVVTHHVVLLRDDTTAATTPNRVALICQVADPQKALSVLDEQGMGKRAELGLVDRAVGVSEDKKTMYLFFAAPDLGKVDAFTKSKDYTQWLETIGVSGSPRILRYKIEM